MYCFNCGTKLCDDATFCSICGTRRKIEITYCRNCGTELSGDALFCNRCGTKRMNNVTYCRNCGATRRNVDQYCRKCGYCFLPDAVNRRIHNSSNTTTIVTTENSVILPPNNIQASNQTPEVKYASPKGSTDVSNRPRKESLSNKINNLTINTLNNLDSLIENPETIEAITSPNRSPKSKNKTSQSQGNLKQNPPRPGKKETVTQEAHSNISLRGFVIGLIIGLLILIALIVFLLVIIEKAIGDAVMGIIVILSLVVFIGSLMLILSALDAEGRKKFSRFKNWLKKDSDHGPIILFPIYLIDFILGLIVLVQSVP